MVTIVASPEALALMGAGTALGSGVSGLLGGLTALRLRERPIWGRAARSPRVIDAEHRESWMPASDGGGGVRLGYDRVVVERPSWVRQVVRRRKAR